MGYRPITRNDYDPVRALLAESGWQARVERPDKFTRMVDATRADRTVAAVDGARVVGFARALCDDVSNGYISMVVVAADRRGQGIGRAMVKYLMGDNQEITWVLRAGKNSQGFWQKLGFDVSEITMERTRVLEKATDL